MFNPRLTEVAVNVDLPHCRGPRMRDNTAKNRDMFAVRGDVAAAPRRADKIALGRADRPHDPHGRRAITISPQTNQSAWIKLAVIRPRPPPCAAPPSCGRWDRATSCAGGSPWG